MDKVAVAHVEGLPTTLSGLLRLAVADAKKCEADPRYEFNMSVWHEPPPYVGRGCQVCMAGAVLAQTCGVDFGESVGDMDHVDDADSFGAINSMRVGEFDDAYSELTGNDLDVLSAKEASALHACSKLVNDQYEESEPGEVEFNGRASWATYLQCADMLEAAGL